MSQNAKLIVYLEKYKSINRVEAVRLGILNLWQRISEISDKGWRIHHAHRDGGTRMTRYFLVGVPKK